MNDENLKIKRIKDIGNRKATLLSNKSLRATVNDKAGMISELSAKKDNAWINAHWLPRFRGNTGITYNNLSNNSYWPVELLFEIAGNFPCFPNFGPPCKIDEGEIPAHGHTAEKLWSIKATGKIENAVCLMSTLSDKNMCGLQYKKFDVIIEEQPVHYCVIEITNNNNHAIEINGGWHNTIGSPFLETGCIIDVVSQSFATPPLGGEFDETGRLAIDATFYDFEKAPTRFGNTVNLREVPGVIGYTDFVTGAIPQSAELGWITVVNPRLKMIYMPFFKGPASIGENDIPILFNMLWMQYGGRAFTPWANYDGGTDFEFCLGTENATGAFANGLSFARKQKELLGNSTTFTLKPSETKHLYYGTLYTTYDENSFNSGIDTVRKSDKTIDLLSKSGTKTLEISADPAFSNIGNIITHFKNSFDNKTS